MKSGKSLLIGTLLGCAITGLGVYIVNKRKRQEPVNKKLDPSEEFVLEYNNAWDWPFHYNSDFMNDDALGAYGWYPIDIIKTEEDCLKSDLFASTPVVRILKEYDVPAILVAAVWRYFKETDITTQEETTEFIKDFISSYSSVDSKDAFSDHKKLALITSDGKHFDWKEI